MSPDALPEVEIFTDGGCRGNPGPGAWACVLSWKDQSSELTGYDPETTNNRMELTAAIEALRALQRPCRVHLHTDSEYLRKGITEWIDSWIARGWKTASKKPVKNRDLWERLQGLLGDHEISWHWVKGHAGHPGNERCDELVNRTMDLGG